MKVESVLVTVMLADTGEELDMELPAFLPAGELSRRLLETLRGYRPGRYEGAEGLSLVWRGRRLGEDDSLASVGIWDGSRIKAEKEM